MKEKEEEKIVITIMADYCADGLWLNGGAIYPDYLSEELNFSEEFVERIREPIEQWQGLYEGFNFYTSEEISDNYYETDGFKTFEKLGRLIYQEFLDLDQDEYIIEYFDERTSERERG